MLTRQTLFTIGHSTHSLEYFVSLLQKHQIEVVCDVRSVPYSQHNPQFNRESLKKQLRAVHISYGFLGAQLGARSKDPACYIDGKVQYNYLAEEPSFLEGLRRIRNGVRDWRVAIMCAERDPLTCHRTILVCRELRSPDLEIKHILANGSIETNAAAERRLMDMMDIRPDMFHRESECIEQAYDMQADRIAYVIDAKVATQQDRSLSDEDLHDRVHE